MRSKSLYGTAVAGLHVACAIGIAVAPMETAYAQEARRSFDIPAQSLGAALVEFSRQSEIVMTAPSELTRGRQTKALKGAMTIDQAMQRLLDGTGLTARSTGAQTYTVVPLGGDGSVQTGETEAGSAAAVYESAEIIVTAQKRGEALKDVPISVAVLGGEQLDRSSFQGVAEALSTVPGVAVLAGAQSGGTFLAVRGVTATSDIFNGASPIAYYLDYAPFGLVRSAFAPDSNPYDLARVEVLRGPQGTLYGASALNGVVRVLTNEANLNEIEFKVRAGASTTRGGGENYRGDAAVNVPVIDGKLAVRAIVGYQDLDGWIESKFASNVNTQRLRNYRVKVNAQPTEEIAVGLSWWRSDNDYGAPSAANDAGSNSADFPQPNALVYDVYSLNASYTASAFSISSTTSYLDYRGRGRLDGNPYGAPFILTTDLDSQVFSQEVLLRSEGDGVWRWSTGAFYRDGKDLVYQQAIFQSFSALGNNFFDKSKSYAVYGEVGRKFADSKLEVTLGARYFHDKIKTVLQSPSPAGQEVLIGIPVSDSFNSVTPRAVLSWYPSKNWTAYVSYSQGFRSGIGQFPSVSISNPDIPFANPDKLTNYEIGSKGSLFNGIISFEAALFYIYWKDIQQTLTILTGDGTGTPALVNGTSASGLGMDLGLTVEPIDDFKVGVNFGWNDLTLDEDVFSGGNLLFDKGARLNGSPEYTVGGWLKYEFPLGSSGYRGRWTASANYNTERNTTTLDNFSGARFFNQSDKIFITRTSLALDAPKNWSATLYVDNLTNDRGALTRDVLNPFSNPRMRPRTVGIQLDYRY